MAQPDRTLQSPGLFRPRVSLHTQLGDDALYVLLVEPYNNLLYDTTERAQMTCSTHSKVTIFEIYTSHGQSRLSHQALVLVILPLLIILSSCSEENVTSVRQLSSPDSATLEFYKGQSVITNPNKYGYLYDTLPDTIPELCQVVQGLLWHEFLPSQYGVKLSGRRKEASLREVERILQRAMERSDSL